MIEPNRNASVEEWAELFVDPDDAFERRQVLTRCIQHVPFDAEVTEERGAGAKSQRVTAPRRVRHRSPDVGAHVFGREHMAESSLDPLAVERVVAVARPCPAGAAEDAEVDASATRRTGLELDGWVSGAEVIDQRVDGDRLSMDRRTSVRRALHDRPVHVPFHVGDRVLGEQCADLVQQIGAHLWARHVEYKLVASEHGVVAEVGQHPVGMGAVQIGVRIDHLWFEPQPELHAQPDDVVDDRPETVGPDRSVDPPVAQAGAVIASSVEPAVVHDESFDAELGRTIGELEQGGELMVEIDGFPDVQRHRSGPGRGARIVAQLLMESLAHAVRAVGGMGEGDPRSGVRLAGGERYLTRHEQLLDLQASAAIGR